MGKIPLIIISSKLADAAKEQSNFDRQAAQHKTGKLVDFTSFTTVKKGKKVELNNRGIIIAFHICKLA